MSGGIPRTVRAGRARGTRAWRGSRGILHGCLRRHPSPVAWRLRIRARICVVPGELQAFEAFGNLVDQLFVEGAVRRDRDRYLEVGVGPEQRPVVERCAGCIGYDGA